MGRNITAAAKPIKLAVQRNARAIPVRGSKSTGLREALARATRVSIRTAGKNVGVSVLTDGKKMPAGQETLPGYMEGESMGRTLRWRHPVYGPHDSDTWVAQDSHPYFKPAVDAGIPGVDRAVMAAIDETVIELERGSL